MKKLAIYKTATIRSGVDVALKVETMDLIFDRSQEVWCGSGDAWVSVCFENKANLPVCHDTVD